MCLKIYLFILLAMGIGPSLILLGQEPEKTGKIKFILKEKESKKPVEWAYVLLQRNGKSYLGSTDSSGIYYFSSLPLGKYNIIIHHINYIRIQQEIELTDTLELTYLLAKQHYLLKDIYVTAREMKGMTTSSHIGRDAIERIQPSSIVDILELIPGGYASDPALGMPNLIALREVNRPSSNYNTSSLGTSFVIDGRRLNTDANMQWMLGGTNTSSTDYVPNFINSGIDMRTISTDDIDSVIIVRGIPSVKYGELTSGLLQIERKRGGSLLDARFKADRNSKLFYVGKGFENTKKGLTLNVGLDYLDYNPEKRTSVYGYKRYTANIRGSKTWNSDRARWMMDMTLDYIGSFDVAKEDKEMNDGHKDRYENRYNNTAWSMGLNYKNKRKKALLSNADFTASLTYEKDLMKREKYIYFGGRTHVAISNHEEGEFDATILPNEYTGYQEVDGAPFYGYFQGFATLNLSVNKMKNELMLGGDWNMSKNFGRGQVFDSLKPPFGGGSYRPRPYKDIPASHVVGLFAEDMTSIPIGEHYFRMQLGIRTTSMLNLDKKYKMHGKMYVDPRLNIQWQFPDIPLFNDNLKFTVSGSIGKHTKTPTLDYLYPDTDYFDILEFVLQADCPAQRVHYRTYKEDPTNYQLEPARNTKWEIRGDIEFAGIMASVAWYQEDMKSGFRNVSAYRIFDYNRYTMPADCDYHQFDGPIPLEVLDKVEEKRIFSTSRLQNGSRTFKKGLEYTLMTPRYPAIATRFTVSGAWTFVRYKNSVPFYELSHRSVGSLEGQYIGKYDEDDSYVRWLSNTNFNADTYLPKIGLGFSLSFQCFWTESELREPFERYPTHYIGVDGVEHVYTKEVASQNPDLQILVRDSNGGWFERSFTPFGMNVNLKATKKLYKEKINLSIFVNKLFDYHPDYTVNDYTIRRFVNAYFGLEMNIKL